MFARVSEGFRARHHKREVGYVDDALNGGHRVGRYLCGHHVAHEEQLRLGVLDDVVYLLSIELMEYGNCHGAVGQRGQEGDGPVGRVTSADGNLVTLLYAAIFKEYV